MPQRLGRTMNLALTVATVRQLALGRATFPSCRSLDAARLRRECGVVDRCHERTRSCMLAAVAERAMTNQRSIFPNSVFSPDQ